MKNNRSTRIAVLGASGFVGTAIVRALETSGADVIALRAPRLTGPSQPSQVFDLAQRLTDCDAVVNAAGCSDAGQGQQHLLDAANGYLPGLIGAAAQMVGARRFVHVSSAAVQGRRPVLDASMQRQPFSPYSRSKCLGEDQAWAHGPDETVVYRPPGVHGAQRSTTHSLVKIARSPMAVVASPGTDNSPQVLVENVGSAVAYLASTDLEPPRCVTHPSENLSTRDVLFMLGGKEPRRIPRPVAMSGLAALERAAGTTARVDAHVRRLRMLLLGQEQDTSWLTETGWRPPQDAHAWQELAQAV